MSIGALLLTIRPACYTFAMRRLCHSGIGGGALAAAQAPARMSASSAGFSPYQKLPGVMERPMTRGLVSVAAVRCSATQSPSGDPAPVPAGSPPGAVLSHQDWQRADLHLVLVHPQIPQNTGNAARTCAATAVALHLVGPLGFELDSAKLRRAGLDYWEWVNVAVHEDWAAFEKHFATVEGAKRMVAFSKLGRRHHASEGLYVRGASNWLVFGAETTGLPPEAHAAAEASGGVVAKIPMANYEHVRSLNLATSVGVGVFEALRQLDGAVLPEDVDNGSGAGQP